MATVGKKFSDPDKWEKAWFIQLSPEQKLLFTYMWERCDHAGVMEFVPTVWSVHNGLNIDSETLQKLIERMNKGKERIKVIKEKVWLIEYIRFNQQNDPDKSLSPKYPFHRHVFKRLREHGLVYAVNERDPILLKKFNDLNKVKSDTYKASLSLSKELPKPTSKSTSKGRSEGRSEDQGIEPPIENGQKELIRFKNFTP